jgi:hypothetical protein
MTMKQLLCGALVLLAAGVELGAQTPVTGRQGAPP